MTDLRKAAQQALEKISKAHEKVSALCSGDERWTMSVPVRQDHDHDVVISDALRASEAVIRAALAQPDVPDGWVPPAGMKVADVGFVWDGELMTHTPKVVVHFEPVPANSPCDAKGWGDRDAFVAMLAAAPKGGA